LGKILEEDKIEIIKTGFRLNQQGKIYLKKYSEANSLFQLKGYRIKYEGIRKSNGKLIQYALSGRLRGSRMEINQV
jgi:hypothetical protein